MEKYYDVISRTLELADTGLEGLEHMNSQLEAGLFEASVRLFADVIYVFSEIEKALNVLEQQFEESIHTSVRSELINTLEKLTSGYEEKQYAELQPILAAQTIPAYKAWQAELRQCFQPYIAV